MNTHATLAVVAALFAGWMAMTPRHVYKVCAWNAGTLRVDPWRVKTAAAVRRVTDGIRSWLASLWTPRVVFTCAAVLLALLLSTLSASPEGVLLAVPPVAGIVAPDVQARRAQLLREADALKGADGAFKTDEDRAAFDAKMAEVDAIDAQSRTATPAAPNADEIRSAAITEERARVSGIQAAVRTARLDEAFAEDLVKRGVTLDQAREAIFAKMADAQRATDTRQHVSVVPGEDARDKWLRGAANWLFVRSGMASIVAKHEGVTADKIEPGEFRGFTLLDLAREALERHGVKVRGLDKMTLAGTAMSYRGGHGFQGTSDFATLLENAMHKVLRAAYAIQTDTWSRWCGIGTVTDFRAHNWYRLGSLTQLDDLNEHGEFKNKAIPDAEKASYQATTKGNIIAITREVIVNDDLGAVMRLTEMLGRAGKLTIEKAAYAKLALNSGLGPTQSDGQALFHSNRSNVGTGSAISVDGIEADRVVMAKQKDPNGVDYLDLRPAVLLVPVAIGGTARVINEAVYDPDTANKLQRPNKVRGLFRDIVDSPRVDDISATRRYLFADPSINPVFMVSFLEGQREPVLETMDSWRTNGVELRARLDFGVDVVDHRGAVTNAGA